MSQLFSKPSIPKPPATPPVTPGSGPTSQQNAIMNAQLAQLGRRQGLVAAMFGYKNPSQKGTTQHKLKMGE